MNFGRYLLMTNKGNRNVVYHRYNFVRGVTAIYKYKIIH